MYEYILFDLDGTLTDPGIGITNSVAYTLMRWNIEVEDRKSLYRFIGPPLQDSFREYYGFSQEDALRAVDVYREYFREKGLYENEVYPGVEKLLQVLKEQGKTLILATSKPEEFAVRILRHFGLDRYFTVMAGATMDPSRSKKGDVIAYALRESGVTEVSKAIMIGDREHDIFGAKQNGLDSIGVLFGYGDREELEKAGATYIAATVEDILNHV